jgi:hypothetical protein
MEDDEKLLSTSVANTSFQLAPAVQMSQIAKETKIEYNENRMFFGWQSY